MTDKTMPALRFRGFYDAWEQRKLGDFVIRVNKTSEEDELPRIEYEDIVPGQGALNKNIFDKKSDKKGIEFKYGDTLFGKLRPYLKNWLLAEFTGIAVGDWWVLRSDELDNKFLYSLIQTPKYQTVANLTSGTKMPRSDWRGVSKTEFEITKNSEEQENIGTFFANIDNLLTQNERKIDLLKQLKQAYLQKIFSQELRFAGFIDTWEQRKLGELANIVRGASPRPIQDPRWFDKDSDIGWLRISDVTEQDGRIHHLEQRISKLGQEKTRVLMEPHLLLSIAATVGKPLVNYVKTGVHDGFLIFLSPAFEREFMFQWLEMFRPKWKKYSQPGSQVNLNSELVRNQEIFLPSIEEQQKIGLFFKQLDHLITLNQQKLNLLKKQKQAYLQKMFI